MTIMTRTGKLLVFSFCLFTLAFRCQSPKSNNVPPETMEETYYSPEDFERVEKIDAHVHLRSEFDTVFVQRAIRDHFRLLNISVYTSPRLTPEAQEDFSLKLIEKFPEVVAYGTTFSLEGFTNGDWENKTLDYLEKSIARGAIAVKVWKNIGMELKNEQDELVMITDPAFDPILGLLVEKNIPLLGHLGEPKNTWLPLEEMTVQGDRDYFRENPRYHMYRFPDLPSYEEQISARDQLLAKNPDIRFVGAHLGSLEYDVNELAKRLDAYPNMAVDMAERISHLQHQAVTDWEGVRDFIISYQDRLIYGTDLRAGASDIQAKGLTEPEEISAHAHQVWLRHWQFFTGDEEMQVPKVTGTFKGLKLPKTVVDKIYRINAEKWYPGILQ